MESFNKSLVNEINTLAMDIQNKGIGEVFLSISGHVGHMHIQIYKGGWTTHAVPDLNMHFGLFDKIYHVTPGEAIKRMKELITPNQV